MDLENPIPESDRAPNAGGEPNAQASHSEPEVPPASSRPQLRPTHSHCQITCTQEKNWWDKIKPFVEITGIVLLAVYTGYTIKMYSANKKSADAAESAANTAAQGLNFTQKQFRMDERPYLSPSPRGIIKKIDQAGKTNLSVFHIGKDSVVGGVAVEIQNTGKSPAIGVISTNTAYKIGPRDIVRQQVLSYKPDYSISESTGILTANSVTTPYCDLQTLTMKEFSKLGNGAWEFYVVGGVRYRDIFTPLIEPYETTYCYLVSPSGMPFSDCPSKPPAFGNSIK